MYTTTTLTLRKNPSPAVNIWHSRLRQRLSTGLVHFFLKRKAIKENGFYCNLNYSLCFCLLFICLERQDYEATCIFAMCATANQSFSCIQPAVGLSHNQSINYCRAFTSMLVRLDSGKELRTLLDQLYWSNLFLIRCSFSLCRAILLYFEQATFMMALYIA
jgi:hypothetical protein